MKKIIFITLILVLFITACAPKGTDSEEKTISRQTEQPITKSEIKVIQKGMEMIISPSQDNIVKGTPLGINTVEDQPEFKRNFGFEVNIGLNPSIKFSWGCF